MSADRLPPGAAEILAQLERGELSEAARLTAIRAMRAAIEGRSAVEIIASGAREMRDEALRAMHAQHFATLPPSTAAKAMARHLARASGAFDRNAAAPPAGTLRHATWSVLRVSDPPAWRTIFRVLPRYPVAMAKDPAPNSTLETP